MNSRQADPHEGDIAQLRKPHPCGSDEWRIVRVGSEIRLQCLGCERRVVLSRRKFERRLKRLRQETAE